MAGYVDIFIQQDGKFSVSLWRGNIQDVESVIEMLVAALLSGVQWRLIMSSDIFAPWRPATATVYNAHMNVCVCRGGWLFKPHREKKAVTVAFESLLSHHKYTGVRKGHNLMRINSKHVRSLLLCMNKKRKNILFPVD